MRGFRDEAPRVVIDEPKTDRDVPADATIPVRVTLDDDFGLHSSRLIYRLATGDSEPHAEVAIPLWTAHGAGTDRRPSSFVKHQEISYTVGARAAQAPGGDRHHLLCRRPRFRHAQGTEHRQEPRDSLANRLQGRRGPPVRRRAARAARGDRPRPHHAEASDHAGRQRHAHLVPDRSARRPRPRRPQQRGDDSAPGDRPDQ